MKIAISGKGGVGKSTLSAALALLLARRGRRVLAIDADPDANLAGFLGFSAVDMAGIVPISQQARLVEERTGAKVREYGQVFKINPEVSDIVEKHASVHNGVALLVLGAVRRGGGGCACPESVLVRALVSDTILLRDEALIMDMEAGIEHLGRGTARGVDRLVIVVEPGQRSIDCARNIVKLASDIGLANLKVVANKVSSVQDEKFIADSLPGMDVIGTIPYSRTIGATDRAGRSVLDGLDASCLSAFESVLARLENV